MGIQVRRQSNFELLRIVSIFLIISFHCVYHGGFTYEGTFTADHFFLKIFWLFGELGVNLFSLISGYFMVFRPVHMKKIIRLVVQVWFYHILTCIVVWVMNDFSGSLPGLISSMRFPIIKGPYWYITVYLLICLLSPWLVTLLNTITQKSHAALLAITFFCWSLIPTALGWLFGVEKMLYYTRFHWGIIVWLWGAYIQRYSLPILRTKKSSMILMMLSFSLAVLAIPIIASINKWTGQNFETAYFWPPNTVLMFLMSLGCFGVFMNMKLPSQKWISALASCTLGIYLLHDGPLRKVFWKDVFKVASYQNSPSLWGHIICGVLIVFVMGVIIDLFRQRVEKVVFERLEAKFKVSGCCTGVQFFVNRFNRFFGLSDKK